MQLLQDRHFTPAAAAAAHLRGVPDQELLELAVQAQVQRNRYAAEQVEAYAELQRRCESDLDQRRLRTRGHFVLTPLDETALEIAGALSMSEHKVKLDLLLRDRLAAWFPLMWDRCLAGRLDLGRARIFVDAAEQLADPEDIPKLARLVEDYFERHDDTSSPLIRLDYRQISNAVRYRRLKFPQRSTEAGFAAAFRKRTVWLRLDDDGVATLGARGAAHDLTACDYRLTLIAKKRCQSPDDDRTLAQMRADTLRDLILGRLTVGALDSDLEADETAGGSDPGDTFGHHEVGAFARPVVNVTVPISALLGATDEPGFLTGDTPIPAELARQIAADPTSTWYRLLTDADGDFVQLSAGRYQPTAPLWRSVVARDRACVWPQCHRPAVRVEVDHRQPYPQGATTPDNLDPLCHRHHMAKHSEGVSVHRDESGVYVIRTRRGSVLRSQRSEQPREGQPSPDA